MNVPSYYNSISEALLKKKSKIMAVMYIHTTRYFQHAHFIPIVGVGKRGAYLLFHGDLPRQHPFGTTLRFTGSVPADSRQ